MMEAALLHACDAPLPLTALLSTAALVTAAAAMWRRSDTAEARLQRGPDRQRTGTWWQETVPSMSDSQFHENMRMHRVDFRYLAQTLSQAGLPRRLQRMGAELALAVLISRLATPTPLRVIGNLFGISESKAHEACELLMPHLAATLSKIIRLPTTAEEWEEIAARWTAQGNSHIPFACGAVDGMQVEIWKPSIAGQQAFMSRHNEWSTNVQCLCDDRLLIRSVVIGAPGSVHDSAMLFRSRLSRVCDATVPDGHWILADRGYPLRRWLLVPYKTGHGKQLTDQQQSFNDHHGFTRSAIERTFGQLKNRWHRLTRLEVRSPAVAQQCILSACILHNFIEIREHATVYSDIDPDVANWPAAPLVPPLAPVPEPRDADRLEWTRERDALCDLLSNIYQA